MKVIYELMKKAFPSLNKRRITWLMVKRATNKTNTLLFNIPLNLDGYFIPAEISASGKDEIFVNSNLSEDRQIATAVHEFKHKFDTPLARILFSFRENWTAAARRDLDKYKRYEYEACAMGAIALLPEKKLKNASRGLFEPEDEFLSDIWGVRLKVRENDGI